MILRLFLASVILLFSLVPLQAQRRDNASDRIRPQWMKKPPKAANASYIYIVGKASGDDLEAARRLTLTDMTTHIPKNLRVTVEDTVLQDVTDVRGGGNVPLSFDSRTDLHSRVTLDGEPVDVYCRAVDEYWTTRRIGPKQYYDVNVIYQVAVRGSARFDQVESTSQYKLGGVWRSAIIPGWGQMYKGNTGKGLTILAGEALFAAGIIWAENERASYTKKINETHNATLIRDYSDKADNMETTRNILIGGTAALYLYNLIDAVTAPGARRIMPAKSPSRANFALVPAITPQYAGFYLGMSF